MDTREPADDDPEVFRLETSNIEETRHTLDQVFYASRISLLQPLTPLRTRVQVTKLGPVTLGDVAFGTDTRFEHVQELGAYHVDIPLAGQLYWRQGHAETRVSTPATAAVYQPVGRTILDRFTADCRLIALKIDRETLEDHLADLLDTPVRRPIKLGPEIDISGRAGRTWANLVRVLTADAGDHDGLIRHPVIGKHLRQSLLTGLLLATEHPYRDLLENAEGPAPAPRAIRRVLEAIHAQPERAYTVADLASVAGISPRALQAGFQRHLGVTPMTYLSDVRLTRAHEQLLEGDPLTDTVAAVADRWGFPQVGRFAEKYRRKYGVAPSHTLRR